jgi:hypothetical protein
MRALLARYAGVPPHRLDYTALLRDTNVFRAGRALVWDAEAHRGLGALLAEAEAREDLQAAGDCLRGRTPADPAAMKVSCELEFWAFFAPGGFRRVLYVGSGAYPQTAIHALERLPDLRVDGVDAVPHCTVLCAAVAEKLGLGDRLRPRTARGEALDPDVVAAYDGFLLSSAVTPKNAIIEQLLRHRRPGARIYAREDAAHPQFYAPVEVRHPDVLPAREARVRWLREKGYPAWLPEGCEVDEPPADPRRRPEAAP